MGTSKPFPHLRCCRQDRRQELIQPDERFGLAFEIDSPVFVQLVVSRYALIDDWVELLPARSIYIHADELIDLRLRIHLIVVQCVLQIVELIGIVFFAEDRRTIVIGESRLNRVHVVVEVEDCDADSSLSYRPFCSGETLGQVIPVRNDIFQSRSHRSGL